MRTHHGLWRKGYLDVIGKVPRPGWFKAAMPLLFSVSSRHFHSCWRLLLCFNPQKSQTGFGVIGPRGDDMNY